MTAIVVVRNSSLDRKVRVSAKAVSVPPSKIHLKTGEEYTTEDLLKALLLNSGNDASVALAESVAGSEEAFVKMMNDMARKIGARRTNFKTSSGLPAKNQYSTAYDLALIVREAMKYKSIVDIMKMKTAEIKEENSDRCIKLKNHNKSLHRNTVYFILGKTGYTIGAGHCFAGYINYGRRNTIVVILKSRKMWMDMARLAIKGSCY
jgi:D-alanyl-D-alanine carboxypeptidase (penicillin-binding protein 5/6)